MVENRAKLKATLEADDAVVAEGSSGSIRVIIATLNFLIERGVIAAVNDKVFGTATGDFYAAAISSVSNLPPFVFSPLLSPTFPLVIRMFLYVADIVSGVACHAARFTSIPDGRRPVSE